LPKRRLFYQTLRNGEKIGPSDGRRWRIISGYIIHVTGTVSAIYARDDQGNIIAYLMAIPTGTGSASFALNPITVVNTITEEWTTDTTKLWIIKNWDFYFTGDAAAYCYLIIEDEPF